MSIGTLPFTSSQLTTEDSAFYTTAVRGRIVSIGVSLKYVGTELNRGGRVVCYTSPDHQNLAGYDLAALGAKSEAEYSTPSYDREKCWMVDFGQKAEELDFCEASPNDSTSVALLERVYPFSNGESVTSNAADVNAGAVTVAALIYGVVGNTYEFEVVEHVEYIGNLAEPGYTENLSDPDGLAMVQSAANRAQRGRVASGESFKKTFKKELVKIAKETATTALLKGGAFLLAAL